VYKPSLSFYITFGHRAPKAGIAGEIPVVAQDEVLPLRHGNRAEVFPKVDAKVIFQLSAFPCFLVFFARQRAEETDRQKRRNEEAKRRKRLEEIRDALPYRMGMKWGLKLGERIIVPPKYRKILPPVGVYCAFEESACRWGVMALDGKVMVEARYQEVDIENNGTVHLTVIPGKVKTVKL
jgi:hypothetical protein